jgi:hypothetical protein
MNVYFDVYGRSRAKLPWRRRLGGRGGFRRQNARLSYAGHHRKSAPAVGGVHPSRGVETLAFRAGEERRSVTARRGSASAGPVTRGPPVGLAA